MLEGLKPKLFYKTFKKLTQWDENFLKFLLSTVEKSIKNVGKALENLEVNKTNSALNDYKKIRESLLETLNEIDGNNSDIFLNITCDGKLLAFHRFKMTDYFYSQAFDARGTDCGKIQSILVKPVNCFHSCSNCGCFFAKLDVLMWVGSEKEASEGMPKNMVEVSLNKVNFTIDRFYRCNLYVHQAKIQPEISKKGLTDAKLVLLINGASERTKVGENISQTLLLILVSKTGFISITFISLE